MELREDTDAQRAAPAATCADIVASPAETAVTRPAGDTVATAGASDAQTAPVAAGVAPPLDDTVA